ncbi:MAG: AAA family ATPase, partial [Actinomycetota bacterium]|nr:AAA family ATPase [Actinomycetota bacterium]
MHLQLEGFGVFRAPVELSFDDVDYFALVGPTGAGKSTIIDALCFALYGSIPRYDDERLVGRVVSLGSQQAKVSLIFDVGDARYRATRVVRLQKGRTGGDALLERVLADGTTEVLAENRSKMKGAVERLLGLSFAHFTKCIVLPQGEFARFLHDEPAKRRDLLVRLLELDVYDRIGQLARERAKEAAGAIELESRQLAELAFATEEIRATAAQRVAQLREIYKAVDAAGVDDDADTAAIAELQARVTMSTGHIEVLRAVVVPPGIDDIAAELEQARAALDAATQAHARASAEIVAAEVRVDATADPAQLARAHDAHSASTVLAARIDDVGNQVAQASEELTRTEALVAGAQELVADRQRAVDAAHDAHRAHALRAHLVAGEPCPVCEHDVAAVPKRRKP